MKLIKYRRQFVGLVLIFLFINVALFIEVLGGHGQKKIISERYVEVVNGVEFEMIRVDGGIFKMGCPGERTGDCDNDELPEHIVRVKSFYIGKFEATQALWRAVMFDFPSYYGNCPDCPVEMVSWNDVNVFIKRLNMQTGKNYRLPTEAEWEFAARGGRKGHNYRYSGSNNIDSVAWYWKNASNNTHPVGEKNPNELGIYDMSGNVWEWCGDWYGEYKVSFITGHAFPICGNDKILRGGCIVASSKSCSVWERGFSVQNFQNPFNGFRLVLD